MKNYLYTLILLLTFISCKESNDSASGKIKVVTTTTIISDLVRNIGGEEVHVMSLMGPGIDPHLYKASEGDVHKLSSADIIFYNGLHLEGKMVDVFEKMERQNKTIANLGRAIDPSKLIESANFGGNYDPHIWFSVSLFMDLAREAARVLIEYQPESQTYFESNLEDYLLELEKLDADLRTLVESLPVEKRRLVTAHDAFSYFGQEYDFEVVGLQGISTATEAGVQDVRTLTKYIVDHQIKSIFIESSVPTRTIEALRQAVLAQNHQVEIGGTLYSDALGDENSDEDTYIGMFLYNMKTITAGLE